MNQWSKWRRGGSRGLILAISGTIAIACGSSNSTVTPPPNDGGSSGGSGSGSSGSGGSGGNSGSSSSGGSSGGSGGSSGGSSSGGSSGGSSSGGSSGGDGGGGCPATVTSAVHVKLNVTWAGTTVLTQSMGTPIADIWLKSTLTLANGKLSGPSKPCGVTLPAITTTALGGSENIALSFPDALWDSPKMPTYMVTGSQTGMGAGAQQTIDKSVGLLGLNPASGPSKYAMDSTAWPDSASGNYPLFMMGELSDDDNDTNPGITIDALNTGGNTYPPTSLDYAHAQADQVYVVSRNVLTLSGTLTSCTDGSGTATVSLFENHVVGCHDASGEGNNCSSTMSGQILGAGFVDANRTIYVPGTATYKAVGIDPNATCAMVRQAVP